MNADRQTNNNIQAVPYQYSGNDRFWSLAMV